jgi:hypothetical protein
VNPVNLVNPVNPVNPLHQNLNHKKLGESAAWTPGVVGLAACCLDPRRRCSRWAPLGPAGSRWVFVNLVNPVNPVNPASPVNPVNPMNPVNPVNPVNPASPVKNESE